MNAEYNIKIHRSFASAVGTTDGWYYTINGRRYETTKPTVGAAIDAAFTKIKELGAEKKGGQG